jgi:hypothetical protein
VPLFGGKREAENDKLRTELARIEALPLRDLAGEVMVKGFGPGGPAADAPGAPQHIAGAFNPAQGSFGIDDQALRDMFVVIVEGLQVLEHAGLVRYLIDGSGGVYDQFYTLTRLGKTALQEGTVEQMLGSAGAAA